MTEEEYVVATDLAKVRMARTILEDVHSFRAMENRRARVALGKLEDKLFREVGELDVAE